jgi:hypothetical protein
LREFTFTGFKLIKFEDELEKEIDEFRKIQIVTMAFIISGSINTRKKDTIRRQEN